jgi:sialic acid synthase SpsE/sugar phosphate isomerase/epimerase
MTMIIDKDIKKYIFFSEENIIGALQKISANKSRIIFSVTETGTIEGVLTDGDFRRWVVNQSDIDLNKPVSNITNKNFQYCNVDDSPEIIEGFLSDKVQFIPLLDSQKRLKAVASRRTVEIVIGDFLISDSSPAFIIAEIGINHNGDLKLAKKLIDAATQSGADCAKFQMRTLSNLYRNGGDPNDISEDLSTQYTLDILSRAQLSLEEMIEVFDYCCSKGILPLCTPWDSESLEFLESYGMKAYKIASADLTNHELIRAIASTRKPIICSTGMSTETEIIETVKLLKQQAAIFSLLHCNSTYPAPFIGINLNYIERLKEIGGCPIGYSGHERGSHVVIAAVAKGCKIIEKHLTLDKSMEGTDHKVSLLPEEFSAMVRSIREVEAALGNSKTRIPSQGELMNRVSLAKSLSINQDLKPGELITSSMIEAKSPGIGLQPNHRDALIGLKVKREFHAGDFFYPSDLTENRHMGRPYKFGRPWGLPVRYHDFKDLISVSNPDFVEFHLSYKDLEQDVEQYFDYPYELDLIVHSPDLFKGDHILDLASLNKDYRNRSISEVQRVINVARELKRFFKESSPTLIVVSMGGFTKDRPLNEDEKQKAYEITAESLSLLDTEGVEIIPQTLPPFPWYFGGQLYLNLFVKPEDTYQFCDRYGYRICLDISHSKLACNYYKISFQDFLQKVSPFAAHLHIVDAIGIDGEGIQVGEGEIDFSALANILQKNAPLSSFIPEIWQGHKNGGEGFWIALERLEKYL